MQVTIKEGHIVPMRTDLAGLVEHGAEVQSAAAGGGDRFTGDSVGELGLLAGAGDPLAAGVVGQLHVAKVKGWHGLLGQ